MELRHASGDACTQFCRILAASVLGKGGTVCREGPVVEAFPNAFLGVLMPEVELALALKLKRGRRFDWLYDRMVTSGRLKSLLSKSLDLPDVGHRLRSETDDVWQPWAKEGLESAAKRMALKSTLVLDRPFTKSL